MNPFNYGQVVSGEDFCGREELLRELVDNIESGQNRVIQGERRIGKSSLIHEAVRRSKKRCLYVDLLAVKSLDEFCERLLRGLAAVRGKHFVTWVMDALKHLRPQVSFDQTSGKPTLSLQIQGATIASLPDLLDLVDQTNKHLPLVVVFDEFQDILGLDDSKGVLAALRSKIQYQGHIPYFFAGSIRNKMDGIFTHYDSAFYKSAIPMSVGPIPYDVFAPFLKEKFESGRRVVSGELLQEIFAIAQDIPGDIQQICEATWAVTEDGEALTRDHIHKAFELIFAREAKAYEAIMTSLTANQVNVLKALAKLGGEQPTSKEFIRRSGDISKEGVRTTMQRLEAIRVIYKTTEGFKFSDTFFKAWLLDMETVRTAKP